MFGSENIYDFRIKPTDNPQVVYYIDSKVREKHRKPLN